MANEQLFDIEREPQRIRDRYGPTLFGQQALAARRLVEAGVPFVRVGRAWWDSHGQNFETHQEMVPELDHVMATLLDDLEERGLLQQHAGHHAGGVRPHAEHQLDAGPRPLRLRVEHHAVGLRHPGRLGLRPNRRDAATASPKARSTPPACSRPSTGRWASTITKNYYVGARPIPLTDPGTEPIREVLA